MNKKYFATPYIVWMTGFTIIPLLLILYYGLTDRNGHFTFSNILSIHTPEHAKALFLSIFLSLISTFVCLLLAYPLAMILKSLQVNQNRFIVFLFILPMWMNFLLRTMAWQTLLENQGVINGMLQFIGLPKMKLINTNYAIIFGMVYNFLPFMILPIYNVLVKISDDTINAAKDLGANQLQVFLKIIVPLTLPGVISGITMVFIPALTTFVISNLLGGGKILLIGNVIEQEFTFSGNWHLGSGLSLVLMVFILISMALLAKYDKNGEGTVF